MSNKREPLYKVTTPLATAKYPHLLETDDYQEKEYGKLEYNTKLLMDPTDTDADWQFVDLDGETHQGTGVTSFVEKIEEIAEYALEKKKAELMEGDGKKKALAKKLTVYVPFTMEVDDEGDETGRYEFKTKCAAGGTTKAGKDWSKELPLFDSQGTPLQGAQREALKLWGGSELRTFCLCIPFLNDATKEAGISLRLASVQVVRDNGGQQKSAAELGFGVVEGGFAADNFENHTSGDSSDGTEEDPEDDDF